MLRKFSYCFFMFCFSAPLSFADDLSYPKVDGEIGGVSLSSGSLNGDIESLLSQASNTASNLEALDSKLDELELLISENSLALEEVSSTTISSVVSSSSGDPWDDYNWIPLTDTDSDSAYEYQDYKYIPTRVKSGDYYYGEASSLSIPDSAKLLLINGQLVNPDATGVVYSAPFEISGSMAEVFKLTLSNRKITLSVVQYGTLSSEMAWVWYPSFYAFDFDVYYLEG